METFQLTHRRIKQIRVTAGKSSSSLEIKGSMSKIASNASMSNNQSYGTSGSVIRRNKKMECFCQDESVFRTVNDVNNVNYGRKFWGSRN
ncbi:hypothetical protein RYX36_014034 [Vicia faba]